VSLSTYDKLVVVRKSGGRIVIIGICRSVPVSVNPRQMLEKLIQNLLRCRSCPTQRRRYLGFD
jgi:hypothetical protein